MTDKSLFASLEDPPLKWLDTGSLSCPAIDIIIKLHQTDKSTL